MKRLVLAALLLVPALAGAAPLEAGYLAARDAHIKALVQSEKRGGSEDDRLKQHELALSDLENSLRRIVGPFSLKGFDAAGKINLDTLIEGDLGFGLMDGLVFTSTDERTRVLVTTDALFKSWLKAHRKWWGDKDMLPQDASKALRLEALYTQAISADAAVMRYADLPIAKPAQARIAIAMLIGRAQDIGPRTPDEVIVTIVSSARVYVVLAHADVMIEPMPACVAIWEDAVKNSEAGYEAKAAAEAKGGKPADRPEQIRDEGDAAFHRCFAESVKAESGFAKLVAQAQAIADALPAK